MASSDHVNFSLRPNKAVERKIVFEILSTVSSFFNLPEYRYLGLGSVWFVDFVMAHKILDISDMVSIESDEILAARAEFNKPFGCITVIQGDSRNRSFQFPA